MAITDSNASTVSAPPSPCGVTRSTSNPEVAQRQPRIDGRRELAIGHDDTITGLPLQAGGHEAESLGRVLHEGEIVDRNAAQRGCRTARAIHAQLELVVVEAALTLVAVRPPTNRVAGRLRDRRDAGVIEVAVALDDGKLLAGERGHLGALLAAGDLCDELQHAMSELLGERDLRRRAHDAVDAEDGVDHVLQVLVGAGDDAAVQVARRRWSRAPRAPRGCRRDAT